MADTGFIFLVTGIFNGLRVQCQEQLVQTGVSSGGQCVHPAVFQVFDADALKRAVVIDDDFPAPAPVSGHVRQRCPIAVQTANTRFAVIQHIGNAYACCVKVRPWFDLFFKARGVGHQVLFFIPKRLQVHIEAALVIGEKRAVAFALQHGPGVC